MQKFIVTMTADARVSTSIEFDAANEAEARKYALAAARAGEVVWNYDGADDDTIVVEDVR